MANSSEIKKTNFIPAITGLRTICAYGIFFYHTGLVSKEQHPTLYIIINQFYSFIPFFFVISAFVIFHTYYKPGRYTKKEFFNYFVSRFARIFPILIILNILVYALSYKDHLFTLSETIKLFLLNITLVKGFSSEYHLTGIGPSWTNSVEEIFYLLAPLLFLYAGRRFFLIKSTVISYLNGILCCGIFTLLPFQGFFSSLGFTAYFTFFGRAFEFMCGIYLALLYKGVYTNNFLFKIRKTSIYIGTSLLVLSFSLLYLIVKDNHIQHANEVWSGIVVNNFIFPIAIFFILYSILYCKTIFSRLLSLPIMVKLGNSTYSFYLLHTTFVLSYIYKYLSTNSFISFTAMVIISFIFYTLIEQPVAKYLKQKFLK